MIFLSHLHLHLPTTEEEQDDEEEQIYKEFFLSERQRDPRKMLPTSSNHRHGNTNIDMRNELSADSISVTNVTSHHQSQRSRGSGGGGSDIHAYDELHEEVDFEAMAAHDPALRKLIDDIDARDRERRDKGRLAKLASQQAHGGSLSSSSSQHGLGYKDKADKASDHISSSSLSTSSLSRREHDHHNNNNDDDEFDKYIASVTEEEFDPSEHKDDDEAFALEGGDDTDDEALFTSADKSFLDQGSDTDRSSVRDNGRIRYKPCHNNIASCHIILYLIKLHHTTSHRDTS